MVAEPSGGASAGLLFLLLAFLIVAIVFFFVIAIGIFELIRRWLPVKKLILVQVSVAVFASILIVISLLFTATNLGDKLLPWQGTIFRFTLFISTGSLIASMVELALAFFRRQKHKLEESNTAEKENSEARAAH